MRIFSKTRKLFLSSAWALLAACAHKPASDCVVRRAAFDLGSSATKLRVADVNHCEQKVLEEISVSNSETRVDYKEDLAASKTGGFSRAIQDKGIQELTKLKTIASAAGATAFAGVATAGFRESKNTQEYLARVLRETGISVQVLPQSDEALLGYMGAMGKIREGGNPVIWDIGGGSQQIITKDSKSQAFVKYEGDMASGAFRKLVISKVRGKNPAKVKSPNPLTEKEFQKAVALAEDYARKNLPSSMLERISQENHVAYGIGPVMWRCVRKITDKVVITEKDIEDSVARLWVQAKSHKKTVDDAFLHEIYPADQYVDSILSNLALVAGFMKALGVKELRAIDANLTDGTLVNPAAFATSSAR